MNWKVQFRELTGWRPKNDEERWRIFTKSIMETSRERYESASAWIFFTKTIFLTNFKRITSDLGCFHQKALSSVRRPWKAQVGLLLFAHPFLLNTPPFCFFCWFFFHNVTKLYGLHNDTYFLSVMSRNLTDCAIIPFLTSGMLRNFTNCATMLPFDFWHAAEHPPLHMNNAPFRADTFVYFMLYLIWVPNYLLKTTVLLQWNKTWDKIHREHYYYNWPIYFP